MRLSSLLLLGATMCPAVVSQKYYMKLKVLPYSEANQPDSYNGSRFEGQYVSSFKVDSSNYQMVLDKKENAVTFAYDDDYEVQAFTFTVGDAKYYLHLVDKLLGSPMRTESSNAIYTGDSTQAIMINGFPYFNGDTTIIDGRTAVVRENHSLSFSDAFYLTGEPTEKGTSGGSDSSSGSAGGSDTSDSDSESAASDSKSSTATSKGPKSSTESSTKATSSKNHAERNGLEGPAAAAVALGLLIL